MRKGLAYFCLVVISVAIAGADYFVLTSGAVIAKIVSRELEKVLGPNSEHGPVTASIDGRVSVQSLSLSVTEKKIRLLSADRIEARISSREGTWLPDSITLVEPRISLSQELFEQLAREPAGRPLHETYPYPLPKIRLRGGQFEVIHKEFFNWATPQTFVIQELVLVPVDGYRYYLSGTLRSELFGRWKVAGELDPDRGAAHVRFSSEEVEFGPRMRAVLATSIQAQWDRYRPEGRAGVRMDIDAEPGKPPQFRLTVAPAGMGICYAGFPYAVEDVRGEIEFFSDRFIVKNASGRSGSARIRFDGSAGGYDANTDFKFRLEIDAMPLDEKLRAAFRPAVRKVYDTFQPSGTIDVRGLIQREKGPDKPLSNPLDVTFRDTVFRYLKFPYEVTDVAGEIRIDSPHVDVKRLLGKHGAGTLEFDGVLDEIETDPVIDLRIRGRDILLDTALKNALLTENQVAIWNRFEPSGPVDVEWRVTKARGEEQVHTSEATAKGCRVTYTGVPLPVKDITGQVTYDPKEVRLANLRGTVDADGGGEVTLSGTATSTPEGTRHHYEIAAVGVKVDPRFREKMPGPIANLLETLKLSGVANFQLSLDMSGEGANETKSWKIYIELRHGVVDTALRFDEIDGTVSFVGTLKDDRIEGGGILTIRTARIMKRRVTDVSATFFVKGDDLVFPSIQGRSYGGTVTGSIGLNMRTAALKDGTFTVDRLELREFIRDTESYANRVLSGKVYVEMRNLAGFGNDAGSLTAEGNLIITDGQLFEVPAIGNVLALSGAKRFDAGKIAFKMADRKFDIETMGFESEAGSLIGRGEHNWLRFDGEYALSVRFVPGGALGLPWILGKAVGGLFGLFMTDRIKGNLESKTAEEEPIKEPPKEPPKEQPQPPPEPPAPPK